MELRFWNRVKNLAVDLARPGAKAVKRVMRGDISLTTVIVFSVGTVLSGAMLLVGTYGSDVTYSRRRTQDLYNFESICEMCADYVWDVLPKSKLTTTDVTFKNEAFYDMNTQMLGSSFIGGADGSFKLDSSVILESVSVGYNPIVKDQLREWFAGMPQKSAEVKFNKDQPFVLDWENEGNEIDFTDTDKIYLMPIELWVECRSRTASVTYTAAKKDVYVQITYKEQGQLQPDGTLLQDNVAVFELKTDEAVLVKDYMTYY